MDSGDSCASENECHADQDQGQESADDSEPADESTGEDSDTERDGDPGCLARAGGSFLSHDAKDEPGEQTAGHDEQHEDQTAESADD